VESFRSQANHSELDFIKYQMTSLVSFFPVCAIREDQDLILKNAVSRDQS